MHAPFPACDIDTDTRPYIFVSYAHKDADAVEYPGVYEIITHLHNQGYRIWYDQGLPPSKVWAEQLEKAIDKAAIFLVFISPNTIASDNVRDEVVRARNLKKPIVRVDLQQTELSRGFGLQLDAIQALPAYPRSQLDTLYTKLTTALDTARAEAPPEPVVIHWEQRHRGLLLGLAVLVLLMMVALVLLRH